ncbi:GNAT family N-acetyltransferase [Streptomyces sp. NPDC102415]|uniref:GNAT family N-acetyltransferase n=1 Tax=Streptomyces sp. NPDC102415 TaxID=3366173 RepID=UPI0037FC8FC4
MHFTTTSEAVRAWVHGWALSRGAGEPDPAPWGFTVTAGPPRHAVSHVLTTADAATVREVTADTTKPGVRLKAFVRAEAIAPWIAPGWSLSGEPGHLMSAPLHPARTPALLPLLPHGYRLRTWTRDGVTYARVDAADGTQAARGQAAVTGATAVVDKVETHPGHRRRGLGRLIMRTLTDAAAEQGAKVGLLASSAEGRALYESTGWAVSAPLANALRGADPAERRTPGSRAGTHDTGRYA